MITIKSVYNHLNEVAPYSLQESYDNSGLIVGDPGTEVKGILLCLDSIESVVDEAIAKGCNLIIAHHPIVFSGLKRLNGESYVENVIIKAIKNDIAILSCHTNLDNVFQNGVNQQFANVLDLNDVRILKPMGSSLNKLETYIPQKEVDVVLSALGAAGAGEIGDYSECSFAVEGIGRYLPGQNSNPFAGVPNQLHEEVEVKVEMVLPNHLIGQVVSELKRIHPYEEVAYHITSVKNKNQDIGAGAIGVLQDEMTQAEFISFLKGKMNLDVVKATQIDASRMIKTVAICGGSGSFLLEDAKQQGADVFITSDFKYHQYFDGEDETMICDIGHYESEKHVIKLLEVILTQKFTTFAVLLTEVNTNPVKYY